MSKPSNLFLTKVKVRQFADGVKRHGKPPFADTGHKHYRILHRTPNPNPDIIYTIIGVTGIREGYSDYLSYEEGYAWVQNTSHKVYVVANTIGRKYKVLPEDMEVLQEDPFPEITIDLPYTLPQPHENHAYSLLDADAADWGPSPLLPVIQFRKGIQDYLDDAIRKWREHLKNEESNLHEVADCYVDAYQSMRVSIFGELLPEEPS